MAERGRQPFYVYRLLGQHGELLYIGKGTGRRLKLQMKRFGCGGQIVASFVTEAASYNLERKLIAEHRPPLNMLAGGGGPRTRKSRVKLHPWFKEIEKVGTRIFTAQALLRFAGIEKQVSAGQLARIKQIAFGV